MSKNTCSASLCETPCFSFFRALPSSHSKATMRSKSNTWVYYHNIQRVGQKTRRPAAFSWCRRRRSGHPVERSPPTNVLDTSPVATNDRPPQRGDDDGATLDVVG